MALVKQNDNSNSHFLPFSGSSCCCCCLSCLLNKEKCVLLLLCVLPACVHFTWCEWTWRRERGRTKKPLNLKKQITFIVILSIPIPQWWNVSPQEIPIATYTHIYRTQTYSISPKCVRMWYSQERKKHWNGVHLKCKQNPSKWNSTSTICSIRKCVVDVD